MDINLIIPLSIILGLVAFGLIARWYIIPVLQALPRAQALTPLLFLHSFRYIGMAFIVPGVVSPDIAPIFAYPAAYGDLLAALLALLAVVALRWRWAIALPIVWIFNIAGTLDLLNAILQGLLHLDISQFGGVYFIPTVVVPALLTTHFMIFRVLLSSKEG
jgi:hypothetical protein